jgi:hypothetical protein
VANNTIYQIGNCDRDDIERVLKVLGLEKLLPELQLETIPDRINENSITSLQLDILTPAARNNH